MSDSDVFKLPTRKSRRGSKSIRNLRPSNKAIEEKESGDSQVELIKKSKADDVVVVPVIEKNVAAEKTEEFDEEIKEADDNDVTQDTPFVPVTDDLRDDGIKRIREAGGKAPKDSFRGSLREGDNAYDLIISDDKIRMTWNKTKNSSTMSGERIWGHAHSKSIFPEHVTELDYYEMDKKQKGRWDIACCSFRCPRVGCCKIQCPKYQRKKMIKPAVVEPCRCELPRCSICSGLNPLTAFIHVCIIGFCFFGWYNSMKAGVKSGAFNMMPAFKNFLYAAGYLVFLLL